MRFDHRPWSVLLITVLAACSKGGGGGGSKSGPAAPGAKQAAGGETAAETSTATGSGDTSTASGDGTSQDGGNNDDESDGSGGNTATETLTQSGTVNIDTADNVTASNSQLRLKSSATLVPAQSDSSLPYAQVGTVGIETALRVAFDDAGTEFSKLLPNTNISDPSLKAIAGFSRMLCLLAESGYHHMVGQGAYAASVNDDMCFAIGDSRSATTQKQTRMLVEATREPQKPINVSFWLDRDNDTTVTAKVSIAKGATRTNPYGIFRMHYKIASNTGNPIKGAVEAYETDEGKVIFSGWQGEGDIEHKASAEFTYDAEAEAIVSGRAHAAVVDKGSIPAAFKYEPDWVTGFNSTHYLAKQSKESDSLAKVDDCRDRLDYDLSVFAFDYRLYDKITGEQVQLWNTFRNLSRTIDGATNRGNITAAAGIYFERPSGYNYTPTVNDGDTIYVDDVPDWTNKLTYTAQVVPGILKKRVTGEEYPLADIKKSWFIASETATDDVIIKYNDDAARFDVVASKEVVSGVTRYAVISPRAYVTTDAAQDVQFENDRNTPVTLHLNASSGYSLVKATVTKSDVPFEPSSNTTYWCFENCPKGGVSNADIDSYYNGGSTNLVFYPDASNVSEMREYTYDTSTGLLKDVSNANANVVFDHRPTGFEGAAVESGELIPDSVHQTLLSDTTYFDNLDTPRTTYIWASGTYLGTRRITLVDANNNALDLDEPKHFTYVHSQAGDRRGKADQPRYGLSYYLTFDEYGMLKGIPKDSLVDFEFGTAAFSLKDGTTLGNDYVVKAVGAEEIMPVVDHTLCDDIDLGEPLALPTSALFKEPGLGNAPSVSAGPKISSGVPVVED